MVVESVQPALVAEYVEPAPEATYGHGTLVVEHMTPASAVTCAAPVTTRTVLHRQVPLIQRVQKMVEVPQVQFIDKVVGKIAIRQRQMSVGASESCAESHHEVDETDRQGPGHESVQVAPNMGASGSHPHGPMSCAIFVGWSSFWCTGKGNSASRRTWRLEGSRGWKESAPSYRTRSAKPASILGVVLFLPT